MQPDETKRPLRYRKLRIAWSVLSGLACVLLIVLWVRSYSRMDWIAYTSANNYVRVFCEQGIGSFYWTKMDPRVLTAIPPPTLGWIFRSYALTPGNKGMGSAYKLESSNVLIAAPLWVYAMFAIIISAAPWFRWRFSLRTLLIGTTLVAVVLGVVVYVTRQ